jgi:hypothetical protein
MNDTARFGGLIAAMVLVVATGCGGKAAKGTDVPAPGDIAGDEPAPADVTHDTPNPEDARPDVPTDVPGPDDVVTDLPTDTPAADEGPDGTDVPPPWTCPVFGDTVTLGTIVSDQIHEASGLAASRKHDGIFWTHNDSGNTARVFALRSDGSVATEVHLKDADQKDIEATDWEDIAMGPFNLVGNALFVADTGDNPGTRQSVVIQVLDEPDPAAGDQQDAKVLASIALKYPGAPVDCESFFVDPLTGDFYLVARETIERDDVQTSRLFRKAAPHVSSTDPVTLEEVAVVPAALPTAADMSADGSLMMIRTYFVALLFHRAPGTTIAQAVAGEPCELQPFGNEPQGEAITILPDNSGFVTVSEANGKVPQDLHFTPFQ